MGLDGGEIVCVGERGETVREVAYAGENEFLMEEMLGERMRGSEVGSDGAFNV